MSYLIRKDRGKAQYQNINHDGSIYNNLRTHSTMGLLIISFCCGFLIFSLWNLTRSLTEKDTHFLFLNPKQPLVQTTSPKFLSFGLDSSLLRNMKEFPILDEKFILLAQHLSPAYVRFGGTSADCLFFNETLSNNYMLKSSPVVENDISNFTFTGKDFLRLYKFVEKSKLRMLFDVNVLIRKSDGSWDDSNARKIVEFAKSQGMTLDWQLGNEPNSFFHVFNERVPAQQLAKDYYALRSLLNSSGFENSILIGPEANHIGDPDHLSQPGDKYIQEFLEDDQDCVNFVSWHQYYLNGRESQVQDFIDPKVFNILANQIKFLKNAITSAKKDVPIWLSETGSAFGGGAPEMSNRFVAGFLFLDKLGYSASVDLQVIIRQSFFGGNYAMVGPDLEPNPDWWVSVIYKQFVSYKVLKLETANNFEFLRLYAHCTAEKSLLNRVPAVTVYGMNLNNHPVKILFQGIRSTSEKAVFMYALTADDLQSRIIKMNGEELKLLPNGELPPFKPIILKAGQLITLPAHSMVFLVMHGVHMSACST